MTEGDSELAPDLEVHREHGAGGHKGESDDSAGHCLGRRESRNEFWSLARVWTKLSVFTAVPITIFFLWCRSY